LRFLCRGPELAAVAICVGGVASVLPVRANDAEPLGKQYVEAAPPMAFETFLDRLMAAESGGRSTAKNPRSTALGPYQFIKSTFLDISRRHLSAEVAGLSQMEILSLRTNRELSRRAAAAFCSENVIYLKDRGHEPTFAHLRLAFLLGAADAARIIEAQQTASVAELLSASVIKANPFMRDMTATDLLAKSERDLTAQETRTAARASRPVVRPPVRARPGPRRAPIQVARKKPCNMKLPTCRTMSALSPQPSKAGKI
jgi:hypothetical protein